MFFIFMEENREIRVKITSDENKQENNSSKPELISFLHYRIIFTSLWFNNAYIYCITLMAAFYVLSCTRAFSQSLPLPHAYTVRRLAEVSKISLSTWQALIKQSKKEFQKLIHGSIFDAPQQLDTLPDHQ